MKTNSKALASFLAAAVWADGEYCEFEQSLVADMGDLLDAKTLTQDLEAAIAATENMSGDELTAHLEEAVKQVDATEKEGILTLCLQMLCSDAFLSLDEVENFFTFAELLGVDEDDAQAILDVFIDEEEDLIIEE
ncbi:MAG: hypothetical protein IJX48_04025 [Paludibacteraceae bacterium]|nr:hypothetical protein [Paludibacteraceae bacterium]